NNKTMNKVIKIIKIFSAYLIRPHLYPELGRKIIKNIFQRDSATKGKTEAEIWCASLAISQSQAITKVTGNIDFPKLVEKFPEILNQAKKTEESTPVSMGGAGALDLIYNLCEFTQAKNALETGVAYGWSSLAALLSLSQRNGTLYSSDM